MTLQLESFSLPKSGHAPEENEDAIATSDPEAFPFRAAVTDGATESAFSGEWARTLAARYVAEGNLVEAAARARALFAPALDGPWYVEQKAAQGAHAALLGLEVSSGGSWRAECVGDCCLFHLRGSDVVQTWPFEDPAAFDHRPKLISSRDEPVEVHETAGSWRDGDAFVLATDALSAWMLEAGVARLLASSEVEAFLKSARRSPDARRGDHDSNRENAPDVAPLRDDDTTAVIIRL